MVGKDHKCNECSKTFSTKRNYDQHMRIHTGEKPFKCPMCEKCFSRDEYLKTHIRLHTGETPFKCKFCDQQFSSAVKLKGHLFIHIGGPHKCPTCPSTCRSPGQLLLHLSKHTEERPFECSECDKKFKNKNSLVCHMKLHATSEKSFNCDFCPQKYRCKSGLKDHLRTHTGKPLKCKACNFKTFYGSSLNQHLKSSHPSEDSLFLHCNMCRKNFKSKSALEIHIRVHTGEKPYKCKFCDKRFLSTQGLKNCIWNHTGEKPYENERNQHKCKICSKFFPYQSNLNAHMVLHTSKKIFNCTQCPKKFKYKSALVAHLVLHNGGNYKCNFCEKEFPWPSKLAEHLPLYTGEKPFKCKLCPYRSKRRVGKSHVLCHEKEEKFKCRFCTLSFPKQIKGQIVLHERNVHGSDIVSLANNFDSVLNAQEAQPFTCNECKFSCFNEKYLCIHYSQCHSLPLVIATKLNIHLQ